MNVELIVHGVLASGQAMSNQKDMDYVRQFYSSQTANELMTVEVLSRPHGLSTYYNYLRYNNVVATREGSYFGLTLRIDDNMCLDVRGVYQMLDNVFQKMVVGKLLQFNGRTSTYVVDSFTNGQGKAAVEQIEKQLFSMMGVLFSQQDYATLGKSHVSGGSTLQVNPYDLTPSLAQDALSKRVRIAVSPQYPQEQMKSVQQLIEKAGRDAQQRIAEAEQTMAQSMKQKETIIRDSEMRALQLESQLKQAAQQAAKQQEEMEKLRKQMKNIGKDTDLATAVAGLKKPVTELARQFAARFPEPSYNTSERPQAPKKKAIAWDKVIIIVNCVLSLLVLATVGCMALRPAPKPSEPEVQSVVVDTLPTATDTLQDDTINIEYSESIETHEEE